MKINTAVVLFYRRMAFAVLATFFFGVMSYVGLVIFYSVSNSWVSPLVLSPSQSKVLSFQPQIAALVLNINKQKSELSTALSTKQSIVDQLNQIDLMSTKLEKTVEVERNRTSNNSISARRIANNKRVNVEDTGKTISVVKKLEEQTDAELKAGLLTADQAAQRKLSLQAAINAYTELKSSATTMDAESIQLKDYSDTLAGGDRSISGLGPTRQLMELAALKSQLKIQLETGERNIDILKKSMSADNRIMQVATDSPYYSALWNPTPVIFIPYDNSKNISKGTPVYDCYLQVILCYNVGEIDRIYDAEEYAKHPLFKSDVKGKFATVLFDNKYSSKSSVLFIRSKPLFI
jgi:hypothetical protein